ncbi:MFS general substrate transporter [Artomyces pyxidatus]|uniref:MFS general substrate transporter n=1 Tax=Artomyces pyxidatus TaxID=48021 RepID=A0ACB8SSY3_9AGAM|nr:MFS general substrate transporter [Artomyces pyxidatus]
MTLAPRVEIYTQLSCYALHQHYNHTSDNHNTLTLNHFLSSPSSHPYEPLPLLLPQISNISDPIDDDGSDDPRQLPSQVCQSDPAVQAGAARLQTVMMTVMGGLSALTTGWWGHFSERHGRTRVLAASTFGLFFTDLIFILVSTPSSPLSHHGHKLLLVSPVIEGLLGGWSALQAATSAYVSDCTSDGSRAHIFSRFGGVFYLGFSLGPTLGAFLIKHPLHMKAFQPTHPGVSNVTTVFWAAIMCSLLNFLLAVLVLPESLDKARQRAAQKVRDGDEQPPSVQRVGKRRGGVKGLLRKLFGPLAIFAPRRRLLADGSRRKKDWSLTLLACALFGYMLSTGLFQIKYMYAEHVFGWSAEQLSYYISWVGGARALHLLFVMPFIISHFKPKSPVPSAAGSAPTPADLTHSIKFDLNFARVSLLMDIASHTLVSLPLPASTMSFTAMTTLSSLASGALPATHSLAVCLLQRNGQTEGLGALFGALSVLLALGQMILGPLLFGLVYSSTVAQFPKAIFMVAASLVLVSFSMMLLIRPDPDAPLARITAKGKGKSRRIVTPEPERGRSRVVKPVGDGSTRVVSGESTPQASGSGQHVV